MTSRSRRYGERIVIIWPMMPCAYYMYKDDLYINTQNNIKLHNVYNQNYTLRIVYLHSLCTYKEYSQKQSQALQKLSLYVRTLSIYTVILQVLQRCRRQVPPFCSEWQEKHRTSSSHPSSSIHPHSHHTSAWTTLLYPSTVGERKQGSGLSIFQLATYMYIPSV